MSAKTEMMQAHEAMAAVLDAKFENVPEWKAFRAIDRALLALESEGPREAKPVPKSIERVRSIKLAPSYVSLTIRAMEELKRPIPTPQLMDYIGKRRTMGDDADKAKINVTSSLSKEKRIKSVPWEGGRAWWFSDRPVPKRDLGP